MRIVAGLFCVALFVGVGAAGAADPQPPTARQLVAAIAAHKVHDGATVGEVVATARRALGPVKWWADPQAGRAGFSYPEPGHDPRQQRYVGWKLDERGTIVPDDDDARIAELGRLPFAYSVNQAIAEAGARRWFDRRLLANPAVLGFLPGAGGNLANSFRQHHLTLRGMTIKWVVDPAARETGGKLFYGFLVTVAFDCPAAAPSPREDAGEAMQFIQTNGDGEFEPLGDNAKAAVDGSGPKCAA